MPDWDFATWVYVAIFVCWAVWDEGLIQKMYAKWLYLTSEERSLWMQGLLPYDPSPRGGSRIARGRNQMTRVCGNPIASPAGPRPKLRPLHGVRKSREIPPPHPSRKNSFIPRGEAKDD